MFKIGQKETAPAADAEGIKYLKMLGMGGLVGTPTTRIGKDGQPLKAEQFLEICGEHALPSLIGLEASINAQPNNPANDSLRKALRANIAPHLGLSQEVLDQLK